MDKGRKHSSNKKVGGPQIRSPQISKESLISNSSPKKTRSTQPFRTKSSNDTTSFSTPSSTEKILNDAKFKSMLQTMVGEIVGGVLGSSTTDGSAEGNSKEVINQKMLERVIKLEQDAISKSEEVDNLKKRIAILEEENKQLFSRRGDNYSDYSVSEISYLSDDKVPVGRGRHDSRARTSESMPVGSSHRGGGGSGSSNSSKRGGSSTRTSSLERIRRTMRVPRFTSSSSKSKYGKNRHTIRMIDLEGKWRVEPQKSKTKVINDKTLAAVAIAAAAAAAESGVSSNNDIIWLVDGDGTASADIFEVNKSGELVVVNKTLHLHESLNLHANARSSNDHGGGESNDWKDSGNSINSNQSSSGGGWLIMREDGWEVDTRQTDLVKEHCVVWKRRKEFTELYNKKEVDVYEYEVWKRDMPILSSTSNALTNGQSPPPTPGSSEKKKTTTTFSSLVRKKRPSINAMAGFSKVMKRGVLGKVLANQIHSAVVAVEPNMTNILKEIAQQADGELVGLEFKFKSIQSLTDKIDRGVHNANMRILENMERKRTQHGEELTKAQASHEKKQKKLKLKHNEEKGMLEVSHSIKEQAAAVEANHKKADQLAEKATAKALKHAKEIEAKAELEGETELDMAAIVWDISDALRYTVLIPTERYTQAVKSALERLKASGMEPSSLKNYWGPGDGYQGINDVFFVPSTISPTKHVKVEIQFHTKESFAHKMAVHGMYEEYRMTKDPTRKVELWKESVEMADTIPVPEDVLSLPRLKTQPMPIETTLYVDLVLSRALLIQQPAVDTITRILSNLSLPGYMMSKKVNFKISSTLMSPSSVEFRIHSETINYDKHHHHKHMRSQGSVLSITSGNTAGSGGSGGGGNGVSESDEIEMKLKDAALSIDDALVINVVLDADVYTTACELAMHEIFKSDYQPKDKVDGGADDGLHSVKTTTIKSQHKSKRWSSIGLKKKDSFILADMSEVKTVNGWSNPMLLKRTGPTGGIGVSCHATMEGEDDGVAFTPDDAYPFIIAFHTAESLAAAMGCQSAWLDYRSANSTKQRNVATYKAQKLAADVKAPLGAKSVRGPKWHAEEIDGSSNGDGETDEDDDDDDEEAVDDDVSLASVKE